MIWAGKLAARREACNDSRHGLAVCHLGRTPLPEDTLMIPSPHLSPNRLRVLLWALPALLAAAASPGCGPNVSVDVCQYGGHGYQSGETFPSDDGCNECACGEDGSIACTKRACGQTCTYDGMTYFEGETFDADDGCNKCTCEAGGVQCTLVDCGTCVYGGQTYNAGESFPADDGCNTCTCEQSGDVACTEIGCVTPCSYEGLFHDPGETWESQNQCFTCTCSETTGLDCTQNDACAGCVYQGVLQGPATTFPAIDGCNTCTCEAPNVSCTEIACGCDPEQEWWREYVGYSPMDCEVIDFACGGSTSYFGNECGCGCEQDPACPPVFECKPPVACDIAAIQQMCPFSAIGK